MAREAGPPPLIATGTKVGWKLPALAVAVAVASLVVLTRLAAPEGPTATPPASTVALAPAPSPAPAAAPTELAFTGGRLGGGMLRSADGLTYADGIPTGINGRSVFRVRDALAVPLGSTMLVGGWYMRRECDVRSKATCPVPTLSDVPLRSDVRTGDLTTSFVALSAPLGSSGAHVVLAKVVSDPRCSIRGIGECQPELRVLRQVWSGA